MITIVLDRPSTTDVSDGAGGIGDVGGREAVDRLFGFTTPLGRSYRGGWNDTSTFVIFVEDSDGAGPLELGTTRVHASTRDDAVRLRSRAGCQGVPEAACGMPYVPPPPRLVGDFGTLPAPPKFLGAIIEDYDNADASYSANDTIIVLFDRPTNRPGGSGGMAFVDGLLNFSTLLGNDYAGAWSADGSRLVVTIVDAGNGTVSLNEVRDENNTVVQSRTLVTLWGEVRSQHGNSPPVSANLTALLSGSVGDNSSLAFPRVVSSVGKEAKLGEKWTITVTLDRATDRGRTNLPGNGECPLDEGTALPHACVLLLFSFTPDDALTHAGASVSGAWTDDSTFVMETTLRVTADDSNPDLPVKFGLNEEDFLQIGSTANIYTSGLKSNGTQYCDAQFSLSQCTRMTTLPNPNVPRLVSFSVRDADNLDAVLSVGDEYVLTFDVPTDQHRCDPACSGGKDFVLRLFAFSAPLASDYSGAWADNSTFVITVTRVDEGFVAPRLDATIAALRPPNAELTLLSADDLQPWLAQSGVDYIDLQSGLVPDRLPLRTADGLSLFAITACAALRLDYCDHEETGDRHVPMLKGSFGVLAAPSIVSFVADDPVGAKARTLALDPPRPSLH